MATRTAAGRSGVRDVDGGDTTLSFLQKESKDPYFSLNVYSMDFTDAIAGVVQ